MNSLPRKKSRFINLATELAGQNDLVDSVMDKLLTSGEKRARDLSSAMQETVVDCEEQQDSQPNSQILRHAESASHYKALTERKSV